jgi:predicted DsbA family dithiol-disulfide isomerase
MLMTKPLKIDFISDISCGWCAVGLQALEGALHNIGPGVAADLHFRPFELNPEMPAGGQNLTDHLKYKYGKNAALQYITGTHAQGAAVGFEFNLNEDSRIYNTFDAHRLLHWAGVKGRQTELKHALFDAHFTRNLDPGDHDVLLACVAVAQLDVDEAGQILASNAFADEVRDLEFNTHRMGIQGVPTVIINDEYVITGSRSVAAYEQFIRTALDSAQRAVKQSAVPCAVEGEIK